MNKRPPVEAGIPIGAQHLRALIENASDMMALVSAEGTFLYASSSTTRNLGYALEEIVGTNAFDLIHPEDVPRIRGRLEELLSMPDGTVEGQCRLRTRDGSWKWIEATGRNLLGDPAIEAIVLNYQDVNERHRADAERQVISEVIHALNLTGNLDELLGQIHKSLKKILYAENCFIALHDRDTGMFHFPFFADQYDTAPPPQKARRSGTAYVFRTGRPMLIPQKLFDHLVEQGEVELVGSPSPSWLGVPLQTPSETIGVLVVQHYEDENAYSARDVEFLASVGGQIALAIERKKAEDALRQSEAVFRLLFSHNPLPTWVIDKETLRFLRANDAATQQYGYTVEEFLQMQVTDIRPPEEAERLLVFLREGRKDLAQWGPWKHRKKNGKLIDVDVITHSFEFGGRPAMLAVAQDITERRLLEDQLRQAQKMEAVGRLAGGVAHDFNNLLMVIKGHTELLMERLQPGEWLHRKIDQIDKAADRASTLTRQLLAFSRMQVLQPKPMNLNDVVEEMGKLLPRLIGEDVELVIRMKKGLGTIRADAGQMGQTIMNLAVNSRDAMPEGGRLMIETTNVDLDAGYTAAHPMVAPGRYVLLAVTDTGTGMDAETRAHIFEPFFTTKEKGKGTGLGLATVYGVIKQSGGFIWVYSEPGQGTTFKIYLPRVDATPEAIAAKSTAHEMPRGSETILLAEDEQDVREIAGEFLRLAGYDVLVARDGADALEIARKHGGVIHLLVTDMIMPGMTGRELATQLAALRPDMKVIFMSGYTEYAAEHHGEWDQKAVLLTKPFTRAAMARSVREVLHGVKES